jgi:hypothetical protein
MVFNVGKCKVMHMGHQNPAFNYSGHGKFMPLPLKSKILETSGFLVTDYIKMFPL